MPENHSGRPQVLKKAQSSTGSCIESTVNKILKMSEIIRTKKKLNVWSHVNLSHRTEKAM